MFSALFWAEENDVISFDVSNYKKIESLFSSFKGHCFNKEVCHSSNKYIK
jgi:hypothetical protein